MRIVRFEDPDGGVPRAGVIDLDGEFVIELERDDDLVGDWDQTLVCARAALGASKARRVALDGLAILAPVPLPPKFLGIGMNYRAHVAEMGREPPAHQYWFNKQRTCVAGPGDPIVLPDVSTMTDYEGELGIVIGRPAHRVAAADWLSVVAGFTVVNDVSVRDFQALSPTFTLGKSFNSHGPLGPAIVTPDEVADPGNLALRTWVNDELRQDSTTADLIFTMPEMVECLSSVFPLEPGDVLATGTPAGVGAGFNPPKFLRDGDVVRIEIESIGVLENPVTSE